MSREDDQEEHIAPLHVGQNFENLFQSDQLKLYQRRTVDYWYKNFPALAETMSDDQIEILAVEAMNRAKHWHGLTERQIWFYMIPIGYWGFYFDIDPQYEHMRQASNWDDQTESFDVRINAFLDQIDIFYGPYVEDFGPFNEKVSSIVKIYRSWNEAEELPLARLKMRLNAILSELFPRKWKDLSNEAKEKTLETNLKRAISLELSSKDSIMYAIAGVYFGYAFDRSPVFPWAAVLNDKQLSAEKRVKQFIVNVEQFFTKLISNMKRHEKD